MIIIHIKEFKHSGFYIVKSGTRYSNFYFKKYYIALMSSEKELKITSSFRELTDKTYK